MDQTFDPAFFETLRKAETDHFWFSVRRRWIHDRLAAFIAPPARFLEIGCGTGNVSSYLSCQGYDVVGCEYYPGALQMAWPDFVRVQAHASDLPFQDSGFDAAGLFDVIEHLEDDRAPLIEAARVVRPGGFVVVAVPARDELWSHVDVASFHKRRYTSARIQDLAGALGLRPRAIEYMFMSLYLPMKILRAKHDSAQRSSTKIDPIVNKWLTKLFDAERRMSKSIRLPIGTSILAVLQKPG